MNKFFAGIAAIAALTALIELIAFIITKETPSNWSIGFNMFLATWLFVKLAIEWYKED